MQSSLQFIDAYFTDEKSLSSVFIAIGLISIVTAILFFTIIKYTLYRGISTVFLILGLIQLVVGVSVYSQTKSNLSRVTTALNNNNSSDKQLEIERTHHIISNLSYFKLSEILFLLIGVMLFIFCKHSSQKFWKGIGLGLVIQASLLFILDFIAQNNAILYLNTLIKIV